MHPEEDENKEVKLEILRIDTKIKELSKLDARQKAAHLESKKLVELVKEPKSVQIKEKLDERTSALCAEIEAIIKVRSQIQ